MGRDPNQDQTPDLFPTGVGPSPNQQRTSGSPSRRPALPKDLPKAVRYLSDGELDWLIRTAIQEAKRRGRPIPLGEVPAGPPTVSPEAVTNQVRPMGKPNPQPQSELAKTTVTRGQVNAVWAAFKAGVTPARIARQFGLSQSQVRKALLADEPGQ
jgi:hypothetical protein